jgi:hypothetical protein
VGNHRAANDWQVKDRDTQSATMSAAAPKWFDRKAPWRVQNTSIRFPANTNPEARPLLDANMMPIKTFP